MRKNWIILCSILLCCRAGAEERHDTATVTYSRTIDEVVVTGTRNATDIRHLPMTLSVVDRKTIEQNYEPSLLPTLTEQVPGLFITSRGVMGYGVSDGSAGSMTLRGIGGNPTTGMLVLIDGHPQYAGLMGHPIADAYQSMIAERVEVLRGPASVLYGSNAMGGVINIVTRRQAEDGVNTDVMAGYGSYNTLQTEVANRVRKGRFSSTVTASYDRSDGHRENMEFEQFGGYVKLGYDFSDRWKMYGDLNMIHYNASNPGKVTELMVDNDSRITRGVASLVLQNTYDRTSGAVSVYYNWGRHKINDGYTLASSLEEGFVPNDDRFNSKDHMLGVSWYQSASFFTGNRITAGIDYQYFGGRAWSHYVSDGHDEEIADRSVHELAGYADFRQTLWNWLTLDAGLRIDHHSQTGTEWVPQGGLSFVLPCHAGLKAMVSKGFRNPTIREMFMFPSQNPDLRPENIVNYELSFTQSLMDGALSYGANFYYINGDNVIMTDYSTRPPHNINSGEIENWGIEADLSYRINRMWTVSANYSWLHMENPVLAAPEHKFFAQGTFTWKRFSATVDLQYVRGLYTSVSPVVTDEFWLLNASAGYQLFSFMRLFARGENLLAQNYEINAGYPMPKATVTGGVKLNF